LALRVGLKEVLITTGSDTRGINNALLFNTDKLSLIDWRSIHIPLTQGDTRDILLANFQIKGHKSTVLTVTVNHWPSQGNMPSERVTAAQTLKLEVERERARFSKGLHSVISIGDFNTIPQDEPHPFRDVISAPDWKSRFVAVNDLFRRAPGVDGFMRNNMPAGTYYYGIDWQTLDYFFVDPTLIDGQGLEVVVESFRILGSVAGSAVGSVKIQSALGAVFNKAFLVPTGFAMSSDGRTAVGASDHYPIVVKLKF